MTTLLEQCVKDAVIFWRHIAIEAESSSVDKVDKTDVIRKYNLKLKTVTRNTFYSPYCFYDVHMKTNDCSNCPGILPNGTGFKPPARTPCLAVGSPCQGFVNDFGEDRKLAILEMYELTKRVAEFYNVQVEV